MSHQHCFMQRRAGSSGAPQPETSAPITGGLLRVGEKVLSPGAAPYLAEAGCFVSGTASRRGCSHTDSANRAPT